MNPYFIGGICGIKNKAFYLFGLLDDKVMILDPHFIKDQSCIKNMSIDFFSLIPI